MLVPEPIPVYSREVFLGGEITILELQGKLVSEEAAELTQVFEELVEAGAKKVILDFRALTSANSSGVAPILECTRLLAQVEGSQLALVRKPPPVPFDFFLRLAMKLPGHPGVFENQAHAVKALLQEG